MAMSVRRTAIVSALLLGCSLALAADEDMPDPEFLEYLGMWEESDEDWIIFDEPVSAEREDRSDSETDDEESTEKTDES
jgi:hypothetical protein